MKNHQFLLKASLLCASSYSLLWACSPNNTQAPTQPGTTPQATVIPSTTPSTSPSSEVNPPASVPPDQTGNVPGTPDSGPSAEVSATAPTATPSASSSTATRQEDISVVEKTTFNGKVFDDTHAPLDGVKVTARSLSDQVTYTEETLSAGGTYAFNNAPAGIQIEITAEKDGYTTRRRVEVLKSNKEGVPNANRYDFGTDGATQSFGTDDNALSDKPEIIAVSPGRNGSGFDAATPFQITFSEPMDRKTVEDNFEIRAYTSEQMTADTDNGLTFTGSNSLSDVSGTRVWDKSAFNISWNHDNTQVTFLFRSDKKLPTDKDSDKTPDYQVSFERQDKQLKDKSGVSRSSDYFKLTEGGFERSYKFSIQTDTVEPALLSITANTAENSGTNSSGDSIRVHFTEPLIHYTLGPVIAGGMGGNVSQAPAANNSITGDQAAQNYTVTINRNGTLIYNSIPWSALGGKAVFDSSDPTYRTVLLLAPTVIGSTTANGRPDLSDGLRLTAIYEDGSSENVPTGTFQTSGPGLTNAFNAQYNIGGTAANRPVKLRFTYTDGSTEDVETTNLDAAPSAADLKVVLDNLVNGTPWTLTDGDGGDFVSGDSLTLSLGQGATRLNGVELHGGKPIAWVQCFNEAGTAFANDALGQIGQSTVTQIVPVNGDPGVLEAALNQSLDGQGTSQKFTVSESTSTAGLFEAGDVVTVAIHGNPTVSGKAPSRFTLAATGIFDSSDLNAPAGGLSLFVNHSGDTVDLYRPGDNVFVEVSTTLIDPAGNSLDSTSQSANATAS